MCSSDLARNLVGKVLPKFDWIVIDEAQDLTEMECYVLLQLVEEPSHFVLSCDYNQTIAPTYFNTTRIMTYLHLTALYRREEENRVFLCHNYRNPAQIVAMGNHLTTLRQSLFGYDKRNDVIEQAIREEEGGLFVLQGAYEEQQKLLQAAAKEAYVYIVVPTEADKRYLQQKVSRKESVYTIGEVKGLENGYIVVVNLVSHFKDKWETISAALKAGKKLEESQLYRYLFNMLYVAITRSEKDLCFIDEEVSVDLYEQFLGVMPAVYETYDTVVFGLAKASTEEDFYIAGKKLQRNGLYKEALDTYERLTTIDCAREVQECKAWLLVEEQSYQAAANLFLDFGERAGR